MKVDGNSVRIIVPVTITGGTHDQRLAVRNSIQAQWTRAFAQYKVSTVVTSGTANTISLVNKPGMRDVTKADARGHYNSSVVTTTEKDYAWAAAHEAGHLMGLGDKYKDVKGKGSVALPGFQSNIMGARDQAGVTGAQIQQIIHSPQNTSQH